ncbi:MAG TPA: flagellar basal-body MS-ring/collar protein FliF, partial [Dongiaceae bacterium]|nr:flagellar basal-body MS-ring/collar protein FliF [Dongiaceae bacterium]
MANPSPTTSLPAGLKDRLNPRALLALGVGVALVAGILVVSRWASEPAWVTLYHDLDLSDAAQIGDHLTKADIRHQLGAGGTEIRVAADDVARARVALAKDGLPLNGRPGLELFDKPSWGMTDFTQRVTYQRALEGELARTIGALRGVAHAQVHLVLASDGVLRREERPASASVVLTLGPGVTLAADAVQGITYIVSNSVEELPAENVAVMDDAGHVLSAPSSDALTAGLTSRQLEVQRGLESRLAQKIEALLATVVGEGHARAQVAAQVDFDQKDRTVETFDPEAQVLQTEQRAEGKDVAAPVNGLVTGTTGGGNQTIVSNTYQNSRRVERSVGAGGDIKRLTVAVLVDEKAIRSASAALGGADALARLESMVRDAVGVDSTRGDRLTVLAVPFETT